MSLWDETLYEGAARHYQRGRMPYPPEIATTLAAALGLDGTGRLLDVGCGPGSVTLVLAPLFAGAVGIDADPDMVAVAREEADRAGVRTVAFRHLRAEELPGGLGRFRVITFAQSFHWLDRAPVAATARRMLEPGGAVVHVQAITHAGVRASDALPAPEPPHEAILTLVRQYLGQQRRAGQRTVAGGTTPGGEASVFRAAGFRGPVQVPVEVAPEHDVFRRTEDQVVAAVFSLSYAAPHLFGDRLGAFETDLRDLLRETAPDGRFAERRRRVVLDIWR
jgi:SAM-dependent methyltransferase